MDKGITFAWQESCFRLGNHGFMIMCKRAAGIQGAMSSLLFLTGSIVFKMYSASNIFRLHRMSNSVDVKQMKVIFRNGQDELLRPVNGSEGDVQRV